jgi:hypothetical protein
MPRVEVIYLHNVYTKFLLNVRFYGRSSYFLTVLLMNTPGQKIPLSLIAYDDPFFSFKRSCADCLLVASNTMMYLVFLAKRECAASFTELHPQRIHVCEFGRRFASDILRVPWRISRYFCALIRHSAPISEALSAAVVSVEK